ncbi:MAG: DUF2817 domain-containing protein [Bacteroidales bacterium]|nr:DUF2817 domain-containing protein [Bacteroidales bacterium]MCK9499897.1 DUF2817 domain-containing protein [Bacteroidales bacterium]MDY0315386.1 DUF2817 domain-containing protein [Bacteroidales bacterium]
MRIFTLSIFTIFFSLTVLGQNNEILRAKNILNDRAEVFIKFSAKKQELQDFSRILSIDNYDGENIFAYANAKEFENFLKINRNFELVKEYYNPSRALNMATSIEQMQNWDRYPTYEVYVEMMQKFAQDYPNICKLDTIGFSTQGRLLLAVKISDNVNIDEAEPEFLYTGQMHGDELIGGAVLLRLIDYLLKNYTSNPEITNLINSVQIYINPLANPDGTYKSGNHTVNNSTRYNAQNIDLNRNYKDFIAGNHPDNKDYATETLAFMEYAENHKFVMSANTHSGAELINYPFDTYSGLPADNDWWLMVSEEYANNAHANSNSGYFTDLNNGVTNGYAWYTITGSRQDYMNYYHYCREVTLELSTKKLLDSENLPAHWNYNKKALIDYLKQVTYGLNGIVTDSLSQEPLRAKVFIHDFDKQNSHVYSFSQHGDYYRLLKQGNYALRFSAEGYKSKTFQVEINDYQKTILNVQLVSLNNTSPLANFNSNQQVCECSHKVEFINLSEASENSSFLWDFGDGNTSTEFQPEHFYAQNGVYTVKLIAQNSFGEDFIEKENFIEINLSEIPNLPSYVICENSGNIDIDLNLDGEVFWFENINDENPFNVGNLFSSPELYENTSYFIQKTIIGEEYNGGKLNYQTGGAYVSDNSDNYLVFDCFENCSLHSVKVYANEDGNRTIYLKNSLGLVLNSKEIFIENGEQTIVLDFELTQGENYRLGCNPDAKLFRDYSGLFSNLDYPFNINNIISIKRSNTVWWGDEIKYYPYFYNWNIKLPDCYSAKTPLNIYVNEEVKADFNFSIENNIVSFTNTSIAADSYIWDFGDNTSSTEINPVHTYQNQGEYLVKLKALSECGEDTISYQLTILAGIKNYNENNIEIFPNPSSQFLNIKSDKIISKLEILSIESKLIKTFENINSTNTLIDIEDLKKSYYFIKIYIEDKSITKTFVKF